MRKLFFLLAIIVPTILFAQSTKHDSIWLPLKPFVGEWIGDGGGEPGIGKYNRSYQFILNKNFIEIKSQTKYKPTDKHPEGELHEDIGYFSYDKGLKKFKLRQFHAEGFVNEFVLDSISDDNRTIVFQTVAIENIPKGWKAKETYRIISENEIEETFELAEPNKDFEVYSKVKLVRQK
ncbi:MAG: FABP family protein [Ignavibacteriales bacterium]|nr:FABP family protein [Ignavibacteriales bacterium]